MGAASSVVNQNEFSDHLLLDNAPERLGEEDFKNLCGGDFDRSLYLSLQKPDGYVDRDELLSVASGGREQELYKLYRSYASDDGTISQKSFNNLCRDSKLLSKSGGYAISDSSITFEEGLNSSSFANYDAFRNNMLPSIASKKGVQLEDLVHRLSHVDICETKTVIPLEVMDHALSPEAAAAQLMLLSGDDDEENEKLQKQWTAAVKLQRIERSRIARRKMQMKKELRECVVNLYPPRDFMILASLEPSSPREEALKRLFNKHATRREMNQSQFLDLCRETEIISRRFTKLDAKLVFDKTKAMAKASQQHRKGVIFDKRINYQVFREVLFPCLARDMPTTREDLINILALDA